MGRPNKNKLAAREREKRKAAARHRLQLQRKERSEMDGEDVIKVEPEDEPEVKLEDGYSLTLKGTEKNYNEVSSRKINHDDTACCNLGPLSSSCFVCVQPLTSEGARPPKVTETEYICLLTDMLGLARSQSNNYLKQISEPEKWIGLCHECLNLIKEVGERKELINKMRKEIKNNQQQIVKKLKGTKLNLRVLRGKGEEGNNASNEGRALKTVLNILNFVHRRQYSKLFSDDVLNSQKDSTEPARFSKKILSTVGHPVIVTKQRCLQPRIPKTKTVVPAKISILKLAVAPLKTSGVGVNQLENNDKSDQWRDYEEENPIFLNHRKEDESVAVTDPLALDDDDADCIVNKPCSVSQPQVYYCGLCADDQVYRSEEQLQLHTNQLHRPGSPPPKKVRRKKRQRKQNFSVDSGSEEEFEEIPVEKKPRRPMETASSILFTTSKRQANPEVEEEQVKPTDSVNDDHDPEEGLADSDPDPEEDESEEAQPLSFQYDCPHCPDVKNYGLCRFAQHLAIHQRRPYRCSICSALFPSDEVQMEAHWKKKHSDVEVTTPPEEKFTKMTLDPGQIWKCQGCPSRFSKGEDRDAHELDCSSLLQKKKTTQSVSKMVLTPDLIHSCQICGDKPFQSFDEWRLHRVLHHPDVDRLSCLLCELSFAEKTVDGVEARHDFKMLDHIRQYHYGHALRSPLSHQHRILEECEECGLVFNSLLERQDHFLEVHGISKAERILSCPVYSCGVRFTDLTAMRRHVHRVHFSGDAAVCDVCGGSFNYVRTMVEHKLREHGVLEKDYSPVYACPVEGCGFRTVNQKKTLLVHSQMVHGEARKFICKSCGKGFSDSGKLRRHEHIHENKEKKPYQCEVCGNSFAVRNYLYIHMRLSHENRKFPSTNRKRDPRKTSKRKSENEKLAASLLGNSKEAEEQQTTTAHPEGNEEDQQL